MRPNRLLAAVLAAASTGAAAQPAPVAEQAEAVPSVQAVVTPVVSAPAVPAAIVLPKGTMIRLMVLNEVNSRDHKTGHRFVVRVDEAVAADGQIVIPVGAKGWGEVVAAQGTGGAGKSGRLNARLLHVEADGRLIPVTGERQTAGSGGTGQVVSSVVAFGPLGLLMKGNNATLKAGEIINGYTVSDTSFTRTAATAGQ